MRKKLFAVIMSAMMMITFMPTMAFAATPSYNANYTEVTYASNTYDTVKYVKVTSSDASAAAIPNWDGKIYVSAIDEDGNVVDTVPEGWYYDLSSANLATNAFTTACSWLGNTTTTKVDSLEKALGVSAGKLDGDFVKVIGLKLKMPSSVVKFTTSDASNLVKLNDKRVQPKELGTEYINGWDLKVATPAYEYDNQFTKDQTWTPEVTVFENDGTQDNLYGVTNGKANIQGLRQITIKMADAFKAESVNKSWYVVDKKLEVSSNAINYNGAEHKLAQKEIPGITSTFQLRNKAGVYENVEGDVVSVKNAGTYYVKATAKDKEGKTKTITFSFTVNKADTAKVQFKGATTVPPTIKVAGKYDAKKYLEVTPSTDKAVKADSKAVLELCNKLCDVVVEDNVATVVDKENLTDTERKAIEKEYADIYNNYVNVTLTGATATFKLVDDINFTKAPLTKTYKAKNGKLAKKHTFKVKAKAASGATLVYKIKNGAGKITVNRTSGKVTVKKGLKKGTYKVGVYAITLDTFGSTDIGNHYTLKIKVK